MKLLAGLLACVAVAVIGGFTLAYLAVRSVITAALDYVLGASR